MRKKMAAGLLALGLMVATLSGCGGSDNKNTASGDQNNSASNATNSNSASNESQSDQSKADEKQLLSYSVIIPYDGDSPITYPNIRSDYVEQKFGIQYKELFNISSADFEQKVNIMFASGDLPDVFDYIANVPLAKQLGQEGYLQDLVPLLDKIPNYKKMWSEEEWNEVMKIDGTADGKLYFLPTKGSNPIGQTWVYRQDILDQLGLKFPTTTDELYNVMKKMKEAYPDSVPMTNRWGLDGLITGFLSAFRTDVGFFSDPDKNKDLVYGPTSDKYRELLKFMSKLYKEHLIEKEFPTITDEQWRSRYATNKAFIEHSYVGRADLYNDMQKDQPGVKWMWSKELIGTNGKPGLAFRGNPELDYGPAITTKVTGDKLDRLLQYWDWAATDEGTLFHTFGLEGKTFEWDANKLPKKIGDENAGIGLGQYIGVELKYSLQVDNNLMQGYELSEAQAQYPYLKPVVYRYTKEQEKEALDTETVVTDLKNQYAIKFIMDQLDPNKDSDWNNYIEAMNNAGIKRLTEIKTAAAVK